VQTDYYLIERFTRNELFDGIIRFLFHVSPLQQIRGELILGMNIKCRSTVVDAGCDFGTSYLG